MAMIPWLTGGQPAAPAPQPTANTPYGTPATDPTAGLNPNTPGRGGPFDPSMSDLQAWQQYFASPGAASGGGPPQMQTVNQLVQTGTQFSPTIPWLTGSGAPGAGLVGGLGALGIGTSSDPQTQADLINASPLAGANPANPYYNLILNQMTQGANTPVFTNQQTQVPIPGTGGGGGQYAQVVGGQLSGNYTPEELAMAQQFNVDPRYLPDVVNQLVSGNYSYPIPYLPLPSYMQPQPINTG